MASNERSECECESTCDEGNRQQTAEKGSKRTEDRRGGPDTVERQSLPQRIIILMSYELIVDGSIGTSAVGEIARSILTIADHQTNRMCRIRT